MADKTKKACPRCGKPSQAAARPFCSKRCADIDLGNWFNERYTLPGQEPVDPFDDTLDGPPDERD